MEHLQDVMNRVNWQELCRQKLALLSIIARRDEIDELCGLLHFIDAVQTAAASDGFTVVFVYDPLKEERPCA